MMMRIAALVFAGAILFSVAGAAQPAPAASPSPQAASAAVEPAQAKSSSKSATKRTMKRTLRRAPRGYGFLPGYEPPPDNNRPDFRRNRRPIEADGRYWSWGNWYYGWGSPGFVRGRWNGGSIGPCWKSTPIGFVWICG
jgi:hypothetical protein